MDTKLFYWNEEKNEKLKSERAVCFDDIETAIDNGKLIEIIKNPNFNKHPNQLALVIEINNYIYIVPFVVQFDGAWFLKTVYPSRKFTKKYL